MPNNTSFAAFSPTKIKISRELASCIINLLESLDVEDFSPETIQLYGYVLYALKSKVIHCIEDEPF